MRKVLFILLCALTMGSISLSASVQGGDVHMSVGGDISPTYPGSEKSPILIPTVSIDGYTLSIYGISTDYTLELVDENDTVVYSTIVPSTVNVVVLPATLSGDYELRLYPGGSYYFYGYISL